MSLRGSIALHATIVAAAFLLAATPVSPGAVVQYSGSLFDPDGFLQNDWVIAGTFKPGFDVNQYDFIYGDASGNLGGQHYTQAVADGNFRPIGSGTFANASGAFSGSGTATGIDGLPIYLFASAIPDIDQSFYLALATSPTWTVSNNGNVTIDAATASSFHFGYKDGTRMALSEIPFPEPSGVAVVGGAMCLHCIRRQRR